jgi:hypothetical protein
MRIVAFITQASVIDQVTRPTKRSKVTPATRSTVVAGEPEMQAEWTRLVDGSKRETLTALDRNLAWKLARAVQHLQENPFHPGLQSHKIDALSARYGQKVFGIVSRE